MAATSAAEQPQRIVAATAEEPHSVDPAARGSDMVAWLAGAAEAKLQTLPSTPSTLAMGPCPSNVSTADDSYATSSELGGDLEEGPQDASPEPATEPSEKSGCDDGAAAAESRRCRRCFRKRCCACSALVVLALALLLVGQTVSKPTWQLSSLVVQPEMMNHLIKAFTDPHFNTSITVPIDVEVEVQNDNLVGGQAGTGHFTVLSGDEVLAQVTTEPAAVAARGRSVVRAQSTSTITPETSKYLMSVLPPAFEIRPQVVGEVPVRVLGLFTLAVTLDCEVDVDVLQILSNPTGIIKDYRCSYGIEF